MDIQDIAKVLIHPLIQVQIGLAALSFIIKRGKAFVIILTVYFYIVSTGVMGYVFLKFWEVTDSYKATTAYDAVIVLAGTTDADWYIDHKGDPFVPDGLFYTIDTTERILAGIHMLKTGHAKHILYGKWTYKEFDESRIVMDFALKNGVKPEQFLIYGDVIRTTDEAKQAAIYVKKLKFNNLLLVTSKSHMRRALDMFKKQGLVPDTFSVNKDMGRINLRSFLPTLTAVSLNYQCFYEIIAYISYYFTGYL
ncbi:MAG: YdcF family protein [Candidatus Magnetoovum sp. WYHC-5]|nr:YdcF family protein [Candidatus Magnetoovum sp. WYHC-5]